MPGRIVSATPDNITGWAWHSVFQDYHPIVHLVLRTMIIGTYIANGIPPTGLPAEAANHWFSIDLTAYYLDETSLRDLLLLIGETDEVIAPFPLQQPSTDPLTIEEILGSPVSRPWITGRTCFDAELDGASAETVVDLFYRDYLGRPGDPNGLKHYAEHIRAGKITIESFRDSLIHSGEYTLRRRHMYDAPGAIFSQGIVILAGELNGKIFTYDASSRIEVSVSSLLELQDEEFVSAMYRNLLGKEVDAVGLAHYRWELAQGRHKIDLLRTVAADLEAITRGVVLVEDMLTDPSSHLNPVLQPASNETSGANVSPRSRRLHHVRVDHIDRGWAFFSFEQGELAASPVIDHPSSKACSSDAS